MLKTSNSKFHMDAHTFSAQQVVNLKKDMVVDSMGVVNDRAR